MLWHCQGYGFCLQELNATQETVSIRLNDRLLESYVRYLGALGAGAAAFGGGG